MLTRQCKICNFFNIYIYIYIYKSIAKQHNTIVDHYSMLLLLSTLPLLACVLDKAFNQFRLEREREIGQGTVQRIGFFW